MFVSAQNTIVLLIRNSSQYDNGLRLYYLLLIYCTSASRTGPYMFALDSNVVWHSTTLCLGNAESTRFFGAKLTSCVRPPLKSRPRLHGPCMSREIHEMAVKSSILSIFCGAELVCQCAHWANEARQFFSEQHSRKLG